MIILKKIELCVKIIICVFASFNLCACYDAMYLAEPTYRVNRNYAFYQFYDNPCSYSPVYSPLYYTDPYYFNDHDYCHYSYYNQPIDSYCYPCQPIPQVYHNHYYHYKFCR